MLAVPSGRIGFALGGGVARGLFHIGVLSVLEEKNIRPDIIVGTSMGAIIGALYAGGLSAAQIKKIAMEIDWRRMYRLADIGMPRTGFIQGNRVSAFLKNLLNEKNFSQLEVKFACVAADIMTGEQVVLQKGSLVDAIRASSAIPAIFTPVKLHGHYLVDGGLVNVVPVSVCRDLGADYVIGVNVIPVPNEELSIQEACEKYYDYQIKLKSGMFKQSLRDYGSKFGVNVAGFGGKVMNYLSSKVLPGKRGDTVSIASGNAEAQQHLFSKEPRLADVLSQSLSIVEYHIAMENLKGADMAISPLSGNIGFWQFNKAAEAINAGEIATRLVLQDDDFIRTADGKSDVFKEK